METHSLHSQHDTPIGLGAPHMTMSISEALRQWAIDYATHTAVVDRNTRLSYAELDHRVARLAAGLHKLGLRPGDRAMVQLPNSIAFLTVCFALFRLGAIPVLAMPTQRAHDIDALCRIAEPAVYFIADQIGEFDYRSLADSMLKTQPALGWVVIDGDTDGRDAPFLALDSLAGEPLSLAPVAPAEMALLLLSGGTTGTPKLIPRTHADYLYNFTASAQLCGFNSTTVYLAVLPAAHNFTLACPGILGTLASGGTVVLLDTASCDEAMPLIARERVTNLALVPALAQLWAQAREWEHSDLSSLRLLQVGGARLNPSLASRLPDLFGCQLQQVFGMAEGLLCYTRLDDPLDTIVHTQGRPLSPLDEIRIVDEHGQDAAPDVSGELLTRGPYTIRSYYRAAEQNARSFTAAGYYRTGDMVRRDAKGNLIVEGRLKEQINRGGEKISAMEVELLLKQLPSVQDAAVVAVPDALLGERSCAFLYPNEQIPEKAAVRQALLARGLSEFKLPDQIEIVSHWPLTSVGKIDKKQLLAIAQRGANAPRQRYTEQHVKIQSQPLELASRLLRSLSTQHYTMYEQHGQWRIGLDAAMSVVVYPDGTVYRSDGAYWKEPQTATAIAKAMADLPFEAWCAYGRAHFEYCHLSYGIHREQGNKPLLKLHIPKDEIRVSEGCALIRSLDPEAASTLTALVETLDARQDDQSSAQLSAFQDTACDGGNYKAQVASAVREMRAQAYQKVILSRSVEAPASIDMLASYHHGRRANTPARSFVLRDGEFQAYGFSPETVVEVDAKGLVSTQPLAGTRALTGDPEEDARLERELLQDAKEIAEHAVSVKLAMEEMSAICDADSLGVSEFMRVCRRGTVQHLASRVRGRLATGCNAWTAFEKLFPAVTASGIPKQQALASICRYEPCARGLYSGCIMIFDSNGAMDAALVLRSVFHDGKRCWLQAGAGLVALSTPEREWTETCEKLASVARYLQA